MLQDGGGMLILQPVFMEAGDLTEQSSGQIFIEFR